jgi:hypothetical protein
LRVQFETGRSVFESLGDPGSIAANFATFSPDGDAAAWFAASTAAYLHIAGGRYTDTNRIAPHFEHGYHDIVANHHALPDAAGKN